MIHGLYSRQKGKYAQRIYIETYLTPHELWIRDITLIFVFVTVLYTIFYARYFHYSLARRTMERNQMN